MRQVALAVATLLFLLGTVSAEAVDSPRLVVLVSVDQLRRDGLDPALPGGLGRIAREGRVFRNGLVDHAHTETCPGHVSIVAGRHPGPAGVPGNSFTTRATGRRSYCVADSADTAGVFGIPNLGRSPVLMRVTAIGDWLKDARPEAKVYAISGKDRAAITLGGKRPDGVYWYDRKVGFTTSAYYAEALPDWIAAQNRTLVERVPKTWRHGEGVRAELPREDDYVHESPDYSRTSPHPIHTDTFEGTLRHIYYTPYLDELTLDVARELVTREGLGSDDVPDLLALGLSATDLVGHLYGPESYEATDSLLRIDAALGRFWSELEETIGKGRVLVVLTSDHGVLPIPEWLAATERSECSVEGGRAGVRGLAMGLMWRLHLRFGSLLSMPKEWVKIAGTNLTVDRALAEEHELAVEDVVQAVKVYLEDQATIEHAWTVDEVLNGTDDMARLYRNSYDPERSGDLMVQLARTCLLTPFEYGTTHGTPYLYDREIPIAFHGPGVAAGAVDDVARGVDIAPTLARELGLPTPEGLDGRPLPLD